jgi:hypothetical protein
MTLWRFHCMDDWFPGLWHQWYRHQCVSVGWPPKRWSLKKQTERDAVTTRNALSEIKVGEFVISTLSGPFSHCVGRLGQVTARPRIDDADWMPLVPKSREYPEGQHGRRIDVRWDLTCGPQDPGMVVHLPEGSRLNGGELRGTIRRIRSQTLKHLRNTMDNRGNWVSLLSHFDYERALSGYIATYPHHLEDGLVPYPYDQIREKMFPDKKRLDVLLLDPKGWAVVVECKQDAPTSDHLKQLRHYMRWVGKQTERHVRGILVHGGSRKLNADVRRAAKKKPRIEIVQHTLKVEFASCFG